MAALNPGFLLGGPAGYQCMHKLPRRSRALGLVARSVLCCKSQGWHHTTSLPQECPGTCWESVLELCKPSFRLPETIGRATSLSLSCIDALLLLCGEAEARENRSWTRGWMGLLQLHEKGCPMAPSDLLISPPAKTPFPGCTLELFSGACSYWSLQEGHLCG